MPNNEWGDFQTPAELADRVVSVLNLRPWARILEPTCGIGRFLDATMAFRGAERVGVEVQQDYVDEVVARGFRVLPRNIFDLDLSRDIQWGSEGPLLVVGNPPWVTNAQLGSFGSINLPTKSNIRNLRGFDAMTGASNFDIAEYILLKLMVELQAERPTISLLVKTQVARNVLAFAEQFKLPYSSYSIRRIDAKRWFGASVDACLFTLSYSDNPTYTCELFEDLDSEAASRISGVIDGKMISDLERYARTSFADGESPEEWRSGVKHDAASVMELGVAKVRELALENEYVFPMLKCTDLFRGRLRPERFMVIPQLSFGEDTGHLAKDAPNLWAYLDTHGSILDSRGSSIYRSQPRFAVFGLGDYTFAPFKIAISGLHKEARFVLLGPHDGKPVVLDDACYSISFSDGLLASVCYALLTSDVSIDFIEAVVSWDSKRPISKKLLQRIDLLSVARKAELADLETAASRAAERFLGLEATGGWGARLEELTDSWEAVRPHSRERRPRVRKPTASATTNASESTGRLFD